MRIISGKYKGRRIQAPKKLPVRPTTDLAKESLFNIINNYYHFSGLEILDLFSGTGNIAYEFASRGAQNVTAVDAHYNCIKFINSTALSFEFDIQAVKSDVFGYLERSKGKFDIIFADPPYDLSQEQFESLSAIVFKNELLLENGMLIIEHSKHTKLDHLQHHSEDRKYGGSVFSFFVKEDQE